jgi:hypothetical protein
MVAIINVRINSVVGIKTKLKNMLQKPINYKCRWTPLLYMNYKRTIFTKSDIIFYAFCYDPILGFVPFSFNKIITYAIVNYQFKY